MSDKTDKGRKMGRTRKVVGIIAIQAILACAFILGIWYGKSQSDTKAVCHAKTEDSVITDCSYHNGAWWTK